MDEQTGRERPPYRQFGGRDRGDPRRRDFGDRRDERRFGGRPRRDDRRRDDRYQRGPPREEGPRREEVAFEEVAPEPLPEGAAPPLVKSREVVVPGEVLCTGLDYLPSNGTFRRGDSIVASVLGIVRFQGRLVSIIPLAGGYLPMVGDVIVGRVMDILMTGWRLEMNSAYSAVLSIVNTMGYIRKGEDLTKYYKIGDYLVTKIITVTSQNLIDVTMKSSGLRCLKGGRVLKVSPNKVPRIIGKGGSMIEQIKRITQCDIVVGQNGQVWLKGNPRNELIVVDVIRKIEAEAHIPGLTQRITDFLNERMGVIRAAVGEEPMPEEPEKTKDREGEPRMREPSLDDNFVELDEGPKDSGDTGGD